MRFFSSPPESENKKEVANDPVVGTGYKDGDKGFRKIGLRNTLLMFLVAGAAAYLVTMFISGVFANKQAPKQVDGVQPSKAISEQQMQNPASRLPSDYSALGKTLQPQNQGNSQQGSQATRQVAGNYVQNGENISYQGGYNQNQYSPAQIVDSGYHGTLSANALGNVSSSEQNSWNKSAIRFMAITQASDQSNNGKETQQPQAPNGYQMAPPNTILAGSIIPVSLINGINSEIAGDVVAQVRQDVYDSVTGQVLLIPQGSRLLGTYKGETANGQSRIAVIFNRIILPDGHSLTIDSQKGTDSAGYPGLSDKVDNHTGRLVGAGIMTSFLSAAAQIAAGDTNADNMSYGQLAVQGAAANVMNAGARLLERDMQLTPTIMIRPGTQFTVFINKDLIIPSYGG